MYLEGGKYKVDLVGTICRGVDYGVKLSTFQCQQIRIPVTDEALDFGKQRRILSASVEHRYVMSALQGHFNDVATKKERASHH